MVRTNRVGAMTSPPARWSEFQVAPPIKPANSDGLRSEPFQSMTIGRCP